MLKPQPHILGLQPYVPGKSLRDASPELPILKLASNENPLGPSPAAVAVIQALAGKAHIYPDDAATALKQALADANGLTPGQIILGSGSDEVIAMVLHSFVGPGRPVVTARASFPMYAICAQSFGAEVQYLPLHQHRFDLSAYRQVPTGSVVCLADPNNPTGTTVAFDDLLSLVAARPDVLFLYDAAYEEYRERPATHTWGAIVAQHPNLFVSRTFSKAYALAGLRIGYGYAHPELVDIVARVRPPFNCNALALAAAEQSLRDTDHLLRTRHTHQQSLTILYDFFRTHDLEFVSSEANFVLVRLPPLAADTHETGGQAWARRLLRHNVIVRALPGIGYDEWIRVTTGTEEQTLRFCSLLGTELGGHS